MNSAYRGNIAIGTGLFERLRESIRSRAEVLRVDILERQDVFHDVSRILAFAFPSKSPGTGRPVRTIVRPDRSRMAVYECGIISAAGAAKTSLGSYQIRLVTTRCHE